MLYTAQYSAHNAGVLPCNREQLHAALYPQSLTVSRAAFPRTNTEYNLGSCSTECFPVCLPRLITEMQKYLSSSLVFWFFLNRNFFFFFSHLLFDSPLCSSPSLHTLHYTINTSLQPKTPAMQFPGGCPVPRGACQASLSGSAVCPVILLLYKENSFSFPRGEKKM